MVFILALLIGIVAGLRALTAIAAVSWAAWLGFIGIGGILSFLASGWSAFILILLAIGELVNDKLPSTPSRKSIAPFAVRILSGAISGAVLGAVGGAMHIGLACGILGAVIGTLGGYRARMKLAAHFGRDRPAALIEDAVAVLAAVAIVAVA